jgi:hypothetical protein
MKSTVTFWSIILCVSAWVFSLHGEFTGAAILILAAEVSELKTLYAKRDVSVNNKLTENDRKKEVIDEQTNKR